MEKENSLSEKELMYIVKSVIISTLCSKLSEFIKAKSVMDIKSNIWELQGACDAWLEEVSK